MFCQTDETALVCEDSLLLAQTEKPPQGGSVRRAEDERRIYW
jgi:hypothetical protein